MGLYSERYGSGESCLFIHGAGGGTGSWYFQKELQKSMEVVLLDLPGHGNSPGPSLDSIAGLTEAVFGTISELGIGRCYVAGHSMGGAVAMSLALTHPEAVKGLVLIGTGARLRVAPEFLEGVRKEKEGTVRLIVETAFGRNAAPVLKENGFKEMMKCDAETIYNDYLACDRFDIMDKVGSIEVPTLVVCALSDLLTPPKYSEYLHSVIKGSEIELIEGCGHLMMLEKPREVNRAIEKFVAGLSQKSRG